MLRPLSARASDAPARAGPAGARAFVATPRRRPARVIDAASFLPSSTPHWSNGLMSQITLCTNTLCSYQAISRPSVRGSRRGNRIRLLGRLPACTLCGTSRATPARRTARGCRSRAHLLRGLAERKRLGLREAVGEREVLLLLKAARAVHRREEVERDRARCPGAAAGRTNAGHCCRARPRRRCRSGSRPAAPSRVTLLPFDSISSCCRYAGKRCRRRSYGSTASESSAEEIRCSRRRADPSARAGCARAAPCGSARPCRGRPAASARTGPCPARAQSTVRRWTTANSGRPPSPTS